MAESAGISILSISRMWWLGLYIIILYLAAYILFEAYVISVWCYFATILSVYTYMILCGFRRNSYFKKVEVWLSEKCNRITQYIY